MDTQDVIDLGRQAVMISMLVGSPILLAGLAVGLAVGLLQAITQIQEQTVSFVPKLTAMVVVLSLSMPWLIKKMVEYTQEVFTDIPRLL